MDEWLVLWTNGRMNDGRIVGIMDEWMESRIDMQ